MWGNSGKKKNVPLNARQLIQRYRSWPYACANKNAISCAQIPLRLYANKPTKSSKSRFKTKNVSAKQLKYLDSSAILRKYTNSGVEVEEVVDHPLLDLLYNVNDFMNGFELMETTYLFLELTGNAYWFIVKGEFGTPAELWPLLPQYVKPIADRQNFIKQYLFTVDNNIKIYIDPEFVIHHKYPNPQSLVLGMGKLQACSLAADLHTNMNIYESNLFENRAVPDSVVILPTDAGTPNPEEIKRMKSEWRKQFGGLGKVGGFSILHGGADVKQLGLTPKDMAYQKGRKSTLEEIAGVFGVPLSKLTVDNVNRANAEAGDYSYMKDTVLPMIRRVEQKLNEKLLPMYDERLFVAYDNPVPQDKSFRLLEQEKHLGSGYSSINEERQRDNKDEVEWGDVPIMRIGMAPLGTEPKKTTVPPSKTNTLKSNELLSKRHDFNNPKFVLALRKFFEEQKQSLLKALNESFEKSVKADAGDIVSGWFDVVVWNKRLEEVAMPFVRAGFFAGVGDAVKQLPVDVALEPHSPRVLTAMEERRGKLVDLNAETVKKVRSEVSTGIEAGEGSTELGKRLTEHFDVHLKRHRSVLIALTETSWAYNEGTMQAYAESHVVKGKEWLTAADDRLCEFCSPMNGEILDVEGAYWSKGDSVIGEAGGTLTASYEDIRHPPLHPRCRCTLIPVLKEVD